MEVTGTGVILPMPPDLQFNAPGTSSQQNYREKRERGEAEPFSIDYCDTATTISDLPQLGK